MSKLTDAFPVIVITRPESVTACEAYIAVFRSANRPDVVIAAASLDDLGNRWEQFTKMPLKAGHVQHVIITGWKDSDA